MTNEYACCNSDKSCSQSGVFGSFLFWPWQFKCDGQTQCDPNGAFGSTPFVYSCTCSTVPDPSNICSSTTQAGESCPAGHYLSNGNCLACKKDEWSAQGATSCNKCPCTQTTGDKPGTKKEDCKPRTPNPNNNKCSEEVTKTNEGFCPRCYLDKNKLPTIGYGLNLHSPGAGDVLKKYGLSLDDVKEDCKSQLCLDLPTTVPKPRAAGESDTPSQLNGETIDEPIAYKVPMVERHKNASPPTKHRKPAVKLCLGKDSSGCKYCETHPQRCWNKTDAGEFFDVDYQKDKMRCAKKFAPNQPQTVVAAFADMAMAGCKRLDQWKTFPRTRAIKKNIDSCDYSAAADEILKLNWCGGEKGVSPERCGKVADCIRHAY